MGHFKTGRAGDPLAWNVGFLRRVVPGNRGFWTLLSVRSADRFQRRRRAAVRSEWRLIAASHNLLKLGRPWIAARAG